MGTFSISGALRDSKKITVDNLGKVMAVMAVFVAAYIIPFLLAFLLSYVSPVLGYLFSIIDTAITIIITIGLSWVCLKLSNNEEIRAGDLFSKCEKVLPIIGAGILYSLAVLVGTVFFIIPGIIISTRYMFFMFFIIDKNCGVIEALKQSAKITKGNVLKLLGFSMVIGFINILGALALGVGLLFTMPMTTVAQIQVYKSLSYIDLN